MKVKSTVQSSSPAVKKTAVTTHAELDALRGKITDLISNDPNKAAIILTEWLKEADHSSKNKKVA